jgi:polyisoprenyl-phosphate glycosyltransferase
MEKIAIITPCFNENITAVKFLEILNHVLIESNFYFEVIIIDDASSDNTLQLLKEYNFTAKNITKHILSLKFNCGHQGAIYQGFLYARELDCNRFIVMDSDGEDNPSAINELLTKDAEIVTVVRGKRSESIQFKLGYFVYRKFFYFILVNQ